MITCELTTKKIDTPIGPMVAISDEEQLYLLEFIERKSIDYQIERLKNSFSAALISGTTQPIDFIEEELTAYFEGRLNQFTTPFSLTGTSFQKRVWEELQKIPYGKAYSYAAIATAIGKPTAFRAVALANSQNKLAIIVPCHRVIQSNGALGGYAGGIERKNFLLRHEKRI